MGRAEEFNTRDGSPDGAAATDDLNFLGSHSVRTPIQDVLDFFHAMKGDIEYAAEVALLVHELQELQKFGVKEILCPVDLDFHELINLTRLDVDRVWGEIDDVAARWRKATNEALVSKKDAESRLGKIRSSRLAISSADFSDFETVVPAPERTEAESKHLEAFFQAQNPATTDSGLEPLAKAEAQSVPVLSVLNYLRAAELKLARDYHENIETFNRNEQIIIGLEKVPHADVTTVLLPPSNLEVARIDELSFEQLKKELLAVVGAAESGLDDYRQEKSEDDLVSAVAAKLPNMDMDVELTPENILTDYLNLNSKDTAALLEAASFAFDYIQPVQNGRLKEIVTQTLINHAYDMLLPADHPLYDLTNKFLQEMPDSPEWRKHLRALVLANVRAQSKTNLDLLVTTLQFQINSYGSTPKDRIKNVHFFTDCKSLLDMVEKLRDCGVTDIGYNPAAPLKDQHDGLQQAAKYIKKKFEAGVAPSDISLLTMYADIAPKTSVNVPELPQDIGVLDLDETIKIHDRRLIKRLKEEALASAGVNVSTEVATNHNIDGNTMNRPTTELDQFDLDDLDGIATIDELLLSNINDQEQASWELDIMKGQVDIAAGKILDVTGGEPVNKDDKSAPSPAPVAAEEMSDMGLVLGEYDSALAQAADAESEPESLVNQVTQELASEKEKLPPSVVAVQPAAEIQARDPETEQVAAPLLPVNWLQRVAMATDSKLETVVDGDKTVHNFWFEKGRVSYLETENKITATRNVDDKRAQAIAQLSIEKWGAISLKSPASDADKLALYVASQMHYVRELADEARLGSISSERMEMLIKYLTGKQQIPVAKFQDALSPYGVYNPPSEAKSIIADELLRLRTAFNLVAPIENNQKMPAELPSLLNAAAVTSNKDSDVDLPKVTNTGGRLNQYRKSSSKDESDRPWRPVVNSLNKAAAWLAVVVPKP